MNSNSYWGAVDTIDSKAAMIDANGSIDPSFGQGQQGDESQYNNAENVVAAVAVANAQRQAKQSAAGQSPGQGPSQSSQSSPQAHGQSPTPSDDPNSAASVMASIGGSGPNSVEFSRQGRPLSSTKRAQQNRQAQRAFRQRKEMYIKDLEIRVQELKASKDKIDMLRQENIQLRDYILSLQSRLIEHPGGVPTPPSVYARQQGELYDKQGEK